MAYTIDKGACIGCGSCAGVCPVSCISEGDAAKYIIDEASCISCGACAGSCPVSCIAEA